METQDVLVEGLQNFREFPQPGPVCLDKADDGSDKE